MLKTADLQMATDVEFLLEADGTFLPAGLFLPFQGMVGTDNQGHGAGMMHTAEVRTRPLTSVKQIVSDMGAALQEFATQVLAHGPDIIFLAGHFHHGQPIGGHVHFSSLSFSDWKRTCGGIKLLHMLASQFSHQYDDPEQITQRAARRYFAPTWEEAIRIKDGMFDVEHYHWEFRQWGSFLVSPVYAYATIGLSKAVIINTLDGKLDALWKVAKDDTWSTENLAEALQSLPVKTEDIRDLPEAFMLLDRTKQEMSARWNADFVELW